MIQITCSRSGLVFEAENRRKKVHPEISYWTTHRDQPTRYKAIAVIEKGKKECWTSLEKFEEEIQKALHPEPEPEPDYDFEGAWVARIVGSNDKYRFDREFLERVGKHARFNRYQIKDAEDGIYETCYKSAKGNETRCYYRLCDRVLSEIQLEEVEALFPEPEPISLEGCITATISASEGQIVHHEGRQFRVVKADTVTHWEDEDGISGTGRHHGDAYIMWEKNVTTVHLLPATAEEIAEYEEEQRLKNEAAQRTRRIHEIADLILVSNGATSPDSASYPLGREYVLQKGHFQANKLLILEQDSDRIWNLLYNGRDGDDWSCNNVGGSYVGCYITDARLREELEQLLC